MKKRIVCVLLTLIMLVSLVPATALTASAASRTTSEAAITVLKQLEIYDKTCTQHGTEWRNGYGTICVREGDHNDHDDIFNENVADKELRKKLTELDAAVNSFASSNGLSLSQSKHDALVVFSYDCGTAWMTGTGPLRSAVINGVTGNEFLNAICLWGDAHTNAEPSSFNRRLAEANMYLNGKYSNKAPSNYVYVTYQADDADKGSMPENPLYFYDSTTRPTPQPVPTRDGYKFLGWYCVDSEGDPLWVPTLTSIHNTHKLIAAWQGVNEEPVNNVLKYVTKTSGIAAIHNSPLGEANGWGVSGSVTIKGIYIDDDNVRWGRLVTSDVIYYKGEKRGENEDHTDTSDWIKLGKVSDPVSTGSSSESNSNVDVTVAVTNAYINVRDAASVYGGIVGKVNQGDQLRITRVETANNGAQWGYFENGSVKGWVALMYTNFDSVFDGNYTSNGTVIATATISLPGYVNLRSDAGTDNKIIGALANGTRVDLYEIKSVNGHQWGRTVSGWFCLTYARVTMLSNSSAANPISADYTFTGKVIPGIYAHTTTEADVRVDADPDTDAVDSFAEATDVTITSLKNADDITWGKATWNVEVDNKDTKKEGDTKIVSVTGWVRVNGPDATDREVELDIAKYVVVADSVNVREEAGTGSASKDKLIKGVGLEISDLKVAELTVWGYTAKYGGWVNLASKYVQRNGAPVIGTTTAAPTGKIATIIGADSVKVRIHHALYSQAIGSIAMGTTANILGEADGWYKLDYDVDNNPETDSWVYGQYVQVSEGTVSSGSSGASNGTTVLSGRGTGVIANTYAGVNVRQGAGTGYALVGKILPGTVVKILETKTVGTAKWGRVEQGWICMDYVTMIETLPDEIIQDITNSAGANAGGSTSNTATNGNTTTTTVTTPAIYTGTVSAEDGVKILKTADKDAAVVRTLPQGASITLQDLVKLTVTKTETKESIVDGNKVTETTETTTTDSYWARVNDGWILEPAGKLDLNALDEVTYTVTGSETINVRDTGSINGTLKDFKLKKGDQVKVTNLQIEKDKVWGYMENKEGQEGWVRLDNLSEGAISVAQQTAPEATTPTTPTTPVIGSTGNTAAGGFVTNTSGYRYTGKVINTDELNVRPTASTSGTATTKLKNGASLVIYETTVAEGMAWGRCDAGWVYLYYVDLTPCVNGAIDARVVYNDNTIAYTDMNCSSVAGTYAKMSVIDIYEIVGTMARTDLGWVSTTNLL